MNHGKNFNSYGNPRIKQKKTLLFILIVMQIDEIYRLRNSFTIVGLTGRVGSGCSRFSEIISKDIKYEENEMIRRPEDINYVDQTDISPLLDNNTLFKRKYSVCYNYFKKNNKTYKAISYTSALIFYSIHYGVNNCNITDGNSLVDFLNQLIKLNFKKSEIGLDEDYKDVEITQEELFRISPDFDLIVKQFKSINHDIEKIQGDMLGNLYTCFFGPEYSNLYKRLFALLGSKDYFLGSFLVHSLGNKIRATGDPLYKDRNLEKIANPKHIYSIAKVINKLIKAWKAYPENNYCHICIDSLRNSLEIMFLKERYSAFYMIAIHNEGRCEERIEKRVSRLHQNVKESNPNDINLTIKKVIELDIIEFDGSSIKSGKFYAPDVENCIQKSDIHINNPGKEVKTFDEIKRRSVFYTMTEQWIKINALILHPGLITPSHEERCMQIAFNSKINSGCISRQVGAVITDKYNSIRSVGWNDVPQGSIPCNLRNVEDIINPEGINKLDLSYSTFEKDISNKTYKQGGSFSTNTKIELSGMALATKSLELNFSYCFKTLHNKYEGKDNQVHTRSLHAEENAMLQIAKFGGQPLIGGTLYTTASPCELCAKKAYQLGLKIIYIDPYPGISMQHILKNGYNQPEIKMFTGIIGRAYEKLFDPLLSIKDELTLVTNDHKEMVNKDITAKKKTKIFMEELINRKISGDFDLNGLKEILGKFFK